MAGELEDIEMLRSAVEDLSRQNEALKKRINSDYTNPSEKRALLEYITKKHKISRSRACRLIDFARSTCWYSPVSNARPPASQLFSTLSRESLMQRLILISKQLDQNVVPKDQFTMSLIVYALRELGLETAAEAAPTDLKRAMEIFNTWSTPGSAGFQPAPTAAVPTPTATEGVSQ